MNLHKWRLFLLVLVPFSLVSNLFYYGYLFVRLIFVIIVGLGIELLEQVICRLGGTHWLNNRKYALLREMKPDLAFDTNIPLSLNAIYSARGSFREIGHLHSCEGVHWEVQKYLGPPFYDEFNPKVHGRISIEFDEETGEEVHRFNGEERYRGQPLLKPTTN